MIDAGFGEAQLAAFFANMNIPRMTFPTLKKNELTDGMVIEALAQHGTRS
jgi:hypothetical protein